MPCSRAMAMTFSKKSSSTQRAVGLAGKFRISILGLGQVSRIAFCSSAKKSTSGSSGT